MEHDPWVPTGFEQMDQRILIVGHSHHRLEHEADHIDFTILCVQGVLCGDDVRKTPFFARQPKYLGLDKEHYYNKVALINFIPDALLHRYAKPSSAQIQAGKTRFLRLLKALRPTHIFVTTSRLDFGRELPETDEQKGGESLNVVTSTSRAFRWGTYEIDDQKSLCCRLRHPQAASTAEMVDAFQYMLAKSP